MSLRKLEDETEEATQGGTLVVHSEASRELTGSEGDCVSVSSVGRVSSEGLQREFAEYGLSVCDVLATDGRKGDRIEHRQRRKERRSKVYLRVHCTEFLLRVMVDATKPQPMKGRGLDGGSR